MLAGFVDVELWHYATNSAGALHHATDGQASAASRATHPAVAARDGVTRIGLVGNKQFMR